MKRIRLLIGLSIVALVAALALAAPDPYPLIVNSQSRVLPDQVVYRASKSAFALKLTDGADASDLTNQTVFMFWATNTVADATVTATVQIVSATNGTAIATFSPADVNYAPGRYIYGAGVISNGVISVYRQGIFIIKGSPFAQGVSSPIWTSNLNWSIYTGYLNTLADGPYRPGTNIVTEINADGSVTFHVVPAGASTNSWLLDQNNTAGAGTTQSVVALSAQQFGLPASGTNNVFEDFAFSTRRSSYVIVMTNDTILRSTPTIETNGVIDGQHINILNDSGFTLTFQDTNNLAGSEIQNDAVDRDLSPGHMMTWVYYADHISGRAGWHLQSDPTPEEQATVEIVRNTSGGTLTKGSPVYIDDTQGNRWLVDYADADDPVMKKRTAVGLVFKDILNNRNGEVLVYGRIDGLDTTSSGIEGGNPGVSSNLYVSTNAGALTLTRYIGSNVSVQVIARVGRVHSSQGSAMVQGAGRANDNANTLLNIAIQQFHGGAAITNFATTIVDTDAEVGTMGAVVDYAQPLSGNLTTLAENNGGSLTGFTYYTTFQMFPTTEVWYVSWDGPQDGIETLVDVWAKTDASTCTVSIIEQTTNTAWDIFTTNNASIIVGILGITDTSWDDDSIAVGNIKGIKIENHGVTCKNVVIRIKSVR